MNQGIRILEREAEMDSKLWFHHFSPLHPSNHRRNHVKRERIFFLHSLIYPPQLDHWSRSGKLSKRQEWSPSTLKDEDKRRAMRYDMVIEREWRWKRRSFCPYSKEQIIVAKIIMREGWKGKKVVKGRICDDEESSYFLISVQERPTDSRVYKTR